MSKKRRRGSRGDPDQSKGPTPLPPADDAGEGFDGPQMVPGTRSGQRTTLPLSASSADAPAGQNDWPNDAVRPVWDREVTVARQAPLSDEEQALLHGDEPPSAEDVLAAIDQAGPPVSRTPTLAGIPAAEIPVVQSGPSTLTGIPVRDREEPVTSEEMPASAADLAAVPVVEFALQATIRMPEQSPAEEFAADEKTPLPTFNVPFGGNDSGMKPMPEPPDGSGQAAGQAAVAGLADVSAPLDVALQSAEPTAPEIALAAPAVDNESAAATPPAEFDQAPSTAPGIMVGNKFVPGIRDMMPSHDDSFHEEGTDPGTSPDGVVRGYIKFDTSGIAKAEELRREKPAEPDPAKVFPGSVPPPTPPPVVLRPIGLEALRLRAEQARSATHTATEPMAAVPEAIPANTEPPGGALVPVVLMPSAATPVTEPAPSATPAPVFTPPPAVEPDAPAVSAPAETPAPAPPSAPEEPAHPSLFVVPPPPAEVQPISAADLVPDPELLAAIRDIKRKQRKRWLPWTLAGLLAVLLAIGIGLGSNLYKVQRTENETAVYNEAISTCARIRAQRVKIPLEQAIRDCLAVKDPVPK